MLVGDNSSYISAIMTITTGNIDTLIWYTILTLQASFIMAYITQPFFYRVPMGDIVILMVGFLATPWGPYTLRYVLKLVRFQ